MAELFGESENEDELSFKTENEYAKKYDNWREKEELYKLEQKYGENASEANLEDSSSDSEDDEPLEIPEKLEKDFLKTLSLLKKKDPRVYDPNYTFFEKDVEKRKKEGKEEDATVKPKKEITSLAMAFDASDDESNDGEIFKVEETPQNNIQKKDTLKEFLTGKVDRLGDESEKDLQTLKALWSDPKLNDGEAFLRDYILNKRYMDEPEETDPHFKGKLLDDEALDADEQTVEEQGKFERAYNFRFEEPDQEYLKRYPRTMNFIRPKDDRRARKRAEVRTRKEEEKQKKMEEIARLKALKLKEIKEKISKLKEVTGNQDLAFKDEDIEGDFDPEDHDRRMKAIFDEQYYDNVDTEKPVFPDLDEELEIENWEKYEEELAGNSGSKVRAHADGPHCEDEDFNMDAEYDPCKSRTSLMQEIKETLGKKRRNRKKKSKLAEVLAKEKPKFDPVTASKTYSEYMEEYYKMDCEDVIGGDLPTRFKYREVVPNSFGLSIEEILTADDKELNQWVPLKKAVKYRPDHIEKSEVKTYQQKANNIDLKKKMLPSLFKGTEEEPTTVEEVKTKKKKNKKKKKKNMEISTPNENSLNITNVENAKEMSTAVSSEETSIKSKKKRQKNINEHNDSINSVDIVEAGPSTLTNERENRNKKAKTKDKETNSNEPNTEINNETERTIPEESATMSVDTNVAKKRKKKKKNKPDQTNEANSTTDKKQVHSKDNKSLKRKHQPHSANEHAGAKKIKLNNKQKTKNNNKSATENPMNKLSDERLKAYGLNPKKYRSFLKYKKF